MPTEDKNGDSNDVEMKDEEKNNSEEAGDAVDEVAKREEDIRDQEDMGEGKEEVSQPAGDNAPDTNGTAGTSF